MKDHQWRSLPAGALALTAALLASASAQNTGGDKPDPAVIWQAGLEKLAGRYVYVQVASPGGLWERFIPAGKEAATMRQVSINEIPAALREKLTRAEVTIADLKLPTTVEASERPSPSGRGKLRFYSETTPGRLVLRNLPGIGDKVDDPGEYTGPVVFHLEHQSHSNPSVSGVLFQRMKQEVTWGAATLDYADLSAVTIPKKPQSDQSDDEGDGVITNARILRSGVEIFAFVQWRQKEKSGERVIHGCVRLMRQGPEAA